MKCTPRPPVTPERIAFEEWYKGSHPAASVLRTEKGYVNLVTRVAWRAWQAAKEDAKKPVPTPQQSMYNRILAKLKEFK